MVLKSESRLMVLIVKLSRRITSNLKWSFSQRPETHSCMSLEICIVLKIYVLLFISSTVIRNSHLQRSNTRWTGGPTKGMWSCSGSLTNIFQWSSNQPHLLALFNKGQVKHSFSWAGERKICGHHNISIMKRKENWILVSETLKKLKICTVALQQVFCVWKGKFISSILLRFENLAYLNDLKNIFNIKLGTYFQTLSSITWFVWIGIKSRMVPLRTLKNEKRE